MYWSVIILQTEMSIVYFAVTVVGGGVPLYTHLNIPVSEREAFNKGICQGLFFRFSTIKTCVAVAYRPPNAPLASFDFFSTSSPHVVSVVLLMTATIS